MTMRRLYQVNSLLFLAIATVAILYYASKFLIPIVFAIFLASLATPLAAKLETWSTSRTLAAALSTLMLLFFVMFLTVLFINQIVSFGQDFPQYEENFQRIIAQLQSFIHKTIGVGVDEQLKILQKRSEDFWVILQKFIQASASMTFITSFQFVVTLIYVFLLLLRREKYLDFVLMYIPDEEKEGVRQLAVRTSLVGRQYLWGRIKIMVLLAIMYLITFLAFGLDHAIFFTLFGAIITIIPYVGPFLSGLLPIVFALFSFESIVVVLVFAALVIIIQLIESYLLEPLIMGSEVRLSPIVIIIAIILGQFIWGIAGMILFVPMIAVGKIICDHVTVLKPIGFVLGDDRGKKKGSGKRFFKRWLKRLQRN